MAETRTKELRKSLRQKFSLPVQLVTRRNLEPIPFETLNISEGGVFISTDSPLPVSTEVTLIFFLSTLSPRPDGEAPLTRRRSPRAQ